MIIFNFSRHRGWEHEKGGEGEPGGGEGGAQRLVFLSLIFQLLLIHNTF